MNDKKRKIKLPSITQVKRALYADWALTVKTRDNWNCLLCGCEENITAHHWYVSDHHAHAARYCVDDGATLCYACHIRGIHTRADYVTISKIYDLLLAQPVQPDTRAIAQLMKTELTVPMLRKMWDAMRARPVDLVEYNVLVDLKGGKLFLSVECPKQIAVVGNTVDLPGFGVCEVKTIAVNPQAKNGPYRYTLRRLLDEGI